MQVREAGRLPNRLPADDDHPYRTGAWRPMFVEYDAEDLDVVEGAIPEALDGVYLRNTENPVMPSIGRYHPFDGDGMVHAIRFAGGRASEIVLDGYFQTDPVSRPDPADGEYGPLKRLVDLHAMGARPHRWRFDLRTGACREERLFDAVSEFPSIHYARPGRRHRYVWSMTAPRGWFLFDGLVRFDLETGAEQRWQFPDGVYASESPMAPRPGATAEDDGWLVTFTTDAARDRSECQVFDAARISEGPVARIALPARISSGTHACWAPSYAIVPLAPLG